MQGSCSVQANSMQPADFENNGASRRPPVIFVVFQTGNLANGGVESITQVIRRLKHVRPIVVTQLETPANRQWHECGAEVHLWSLPYQMGSSFWQASFLAKLRRLASLVSTNVRTWRLVRATGCKRVHCNDMLGFMHAATGARLAGASVVFNIRALKAPGERYGWRWKLAVKLSDRVIVLSREMRESLVNSLRIPNPTNIEFIYSIVDHESMRPADQIEREQLRRRFGISRKELALGYVGVVRPEKGQLDFITEAVPLLKKSVPMCKVYFIGDFDVVRNRYAADCLQAVQQLGLEDTVRFVGYSAEIDAWYRALDIVVLASRAEGLARSMIESLASGTPVVSFDVSSAREILERYACGLVVRQGQYPTLAGQIASLAHCDRKRRALAGNGVLVARRLFAERDVLERYERLYVG